MLFNHTTFIGIDLTAGERPLTYAALDSNGDQIALGVGLEEEVLAFVGGQESAVVAVNGPRRPNQGWMSTDSFRNSLRPVPRPGRWEKWRAVEYELRMRGIIARRTPAVPANAPGWIRRGYGIFKKLDKMGYESYSSLTDRENLPKLLSIEVYPHAVYCGLLERRPFKKKTLEGRIQRQLVLYTKNLDVPNPMQIFEEFTRYRLLQGILPDEGLYSAPELDALAGAYTGLIVSKKKGLTLLGHPEEGQVVIPVPELLPKYT